MSPENNHKLMGFYNSACMSPENTHTLIWISYGGVNYMVSVL